MTVKGIDISANQGEFDWESHLAAGPLGFAAIRATTWTGPDSFDVDPQFARNWRLAWERTDGNLVRIAYHEPRPAGAPERQAADVVAIVKDHGLAAGDHFMMAFEDDSGEPAPFVARFSRQLLRATNAAAPFHRVFPYMNPSWAAAGNADGLDSWHLWIANYDVERPMVPRQWRTYAFWQWTGTGLDRDRYNGDLANLLNFARMPDKRRAPAK